jgi:putative permease
VKRLAWYTAGSLATLAVMFLVWEFRIAIILFILSLIVAAILRPMVDLLAADRIPRGLALLITYLTVIALVIAFVLFLGGPVISELQVTATDITSGYEQIRSHWLTGIWIQRAIAQNFPDLNHLFQTIVGVQWNILVQSFLGMTLGSLDLLSKIAIILVLSIYWSADQEHFKRLWLTLLPPELRTRWRDVWNNIENEIGSYLRSELIQSLLTVIILTVGYQLIGLKYSVLLAVFGAICWLIIWFGGLIAVLPAFLAGLSISPAIGLLAALFTIVVLCFLEFVVEPRLYNRQRLSSFLVVVIVLIMVNQYGIIGFVVAPPLAAAIQIFLGQLFRPTTSTVTLTPPLELQIDLLRERLNLVKKMISERPEPPSPEIVNLVDRLDNMIDNADHGEQITE